MGASAGTELAYSHNEAFNLFENIMMGRYWTATEGERWCRKIEQPVK
jgi:hypothetical protein